MSREPDGWVPGEVQGMYARVMTVGTRVSFIALLASYALYIFGILSPVVPLDRVPDYWHLASSEYQAAMNDAFPVADAAPQGMSWLRFVARGDYLNLAAVYLLGFVTVVCYIAIIPRLLVQRRRVYAVMAVLEVLVLLLAACGIFSAGH